MKTLTFKKIDIEAFGAFKYPQKLDLSTTPEKSMILVEGMNGCGKTTFLTALQIVLFGERRFGRTNYGTLIEDLSRKDVDRVPRIAAEIEFTDSEGVHAYKISRAWHLPPRTFHEYVHVVSVDRSHTLTVNEWNELVDQYLPVELADMFFFDGEKIEQMANPDRLPMILKTATQAFLGVNELNVLAQDVSALDRRIIRKKKENSDQDRDASRLQALQQKLSNINDEGARLSQRLAQVRNEIDKAEKAKTQFEIEANRKGLSRYKQSEELRTDARVLAKSLESARQELVGAVSDEYLPLARMTTLLTNALKRLKLETDAQNAKDTLSFMKAHDQRLLSRIGRAYPDALDLIRSFMAEESKRLLINQIDERFLKPMLSGKPLRDRVDRAVQRRDAAKEKVQRLENELKDVQAKLDQVPDGELIAEVIEQGKKLDESLAQLIAEKNFMKTELDRLDEQTKKASSQLASVEDSLRDTYRGDAHTKAVLDAGKRVRDVLSIFREKLLAHKAGWLASAITDHYLRLMRKQSLVKAIEVNPQTYEVSVKMKNGDTLPMLRLSAGERQLLATAVLSALIGERSCSFPVVVDTPLARLDRSHRMNMVKNFYATVSHQVMVLSTDEEITGVLKNEAMQHVQHGYLLIYDETEQATNIQEMC